MRTHALLVMLLVTAVAADASPPVTLEAPRNLVVRDYKPHVILGWTYDGAGTAGFEIERAIAAGHGTAKADRFTRVGAPGRDARTFRDAGSHAGTTYVYRIRAVGAGTVSPWSTELIVRVNTTRR